MKRPGMMIYFDMYESLSKLSPTLQGKMLRAMLEYAIHGVEPVLTDKLEVIWGLIKPRIDMDAQAYHRAIHQKNYANYCKKRKRAGLDKLPYDEWLELQQNESVGHRKSPKNTGR